MELDFLLNSQETDYIEELRQKAEELIDYWNEPQLRENFIVFLKSSILHTLPSLLYCQIKHTPPISSSQQFSCLRM